MNKTFLPKVGQLLYHVERRSDGTLESEALWYVDTVPEEGKMWMATWVATMGDFQGKGLEVYAEPEAGGAGLNFVTRVAEDDDIARFMNVIKKADNAEEQFEQWRKRLDEDEDWKPLLKEEKDRLKRLMK